MKFRPVWRMGALVALVFAALFAVRYIDRIPAQRLASLMGITVTVSDVNGSPTPTPRPTPPGGDQSALLSVVAVQTFAGPQLVRQGAGTAVSSDGLILTTTAAAPYGTGTYVYQVTTSRGQPLRARRVAADAATGLTLLKVDATALDAVLFDAAAPVFAGQTLEAIAAQLVISVFTPQRLPVAVVWVSGNGAATLSLDRAFGFTFNGARLVDASGRTVGVMRYVSGAVFVPAADVNTFIESYLAKPVR